MVSVVAWFAIGEKTIQSQSGSRSFLAVHPATVRQPTTTDRHPAAMRDSRSCSTSTSILPQVPSPKDEGGKETEEKSTHDGADEYVGRPLERNERGEIPNCGTRKGTRYDEMAGKSDPAFLRELFRHDNDNQSASI